MKLLDAAEVLPRGNGDGWSRGWNGDSRACSGIHVYLSDCDPADTADVIGADDFIEDECPYRVVPFGIIAEMDRSTLMMRDDDEDWLRKAVQASAEIPVARGLLLQQGWGTSLGETWIGSPNATEIASPTLTDLPAVAAAISAGRKAFFAKTLGIQPILHVNPDHVVLLKNAGVIQLDQANDEMETVWEDPVVISEGYYDIDGMTANPLAFWTGPIKITLSDVQKEDVISATRRNRRRYQVSLLAAIDTPPCAIVRIGTAPAPVG